MTDHEHHHAEPSQTGAGFWRSRLGIAFIVFAAIAALLLGYEHRLHLFAGNWLPGILLLACLGMHKFMHGGHGGHGHRHRGQRPEDRK